MKHRYARPTVGITVRISPDAREKLGQVAQIRNMSMSATVERLVVEESQRLGPPKKRSQTDG